MTDYNSDKAIDQMYEQHDNPELAGKSDSYIHEHLDVAFPYGGNERTTNKGLVAIVGSV